MMLLGVFVAITLALCGLSAWKRRKANAFALGAVAVGLTAMAFVPRPIDGVFAFAIWTLVSYVIRNFTVASILYLVSALCYILELQGYWIYQIQVFSNFMGFLGLAAIWYGTAKWDYDFRSGPVYRGWVSLGGGAHSRYTRTEEAEQ